MLAHRAERGRLAGRSRLDARVREGSPGAAFASAVASRGGITDVVRVLDIGPGLPAKLSELRTAVAPHARLIAYLLGRTDPTGAHRPYRPSAQCHGRCAAPRDAGVSPTEWDADGIRQVDRSAIEHGLLNRSVVALTPQANSPRSLRCVPTQARQAGVSRWPPSLLPEHSGHRLRLLIKVAMLELLAVQAPDVRRIFTGNAAVNAHMIAINNQLGFEVRDVYRSWELDLAAAGPLTRQSRAAGAGAGRAASP
jgi:hypothetical protein